MAAKKPPAPAETPPAAPTGIPLSDLVRGSLRDHAGRNERLFIRETNSDPKLRGALADELAALAVAAVKHHDAQQQKAKKPRGAIEGRTMSDLIDALARSHRDDDPLDVWPHLRSAIEEWAGDCESVGTEKKPVYRYPFDGKKGRRTISYKQFCTLLLGARKSNG